MNVQIRRLKLEEIYVPWVAISPVLKIKILTTFC